MNSHTHGHACLGMWCIRPSVFLKTESSLNSPVKRLPPPLLGPSHCPWVWLALQVPPFCSSNLLSSGWDFGPLLGSSSQPSAHCQHLLLLWVSALRTPFLPTLSEVGTSYSESQALPWWFSLQPWRQRATILFACMFTWVLFVFVCVFLCLSPLLEGNWMGSLRAGNLFVSAVSPVVDRGLSVASAQCV